MNGVVKFPEPVWGRLATMAEQQGMTIPELLERAAQRLLTGTTRSPQPHLESRMEALTRSREAHRKAIAAEIIRLRGRGHTVAAIASIVGYSNSYVSKILCANGARTWTRNAPQGQKEGQAA